MPKQRKQWTIDIEATERGFNYTFHGIGIVGFEPTREQLSLIVARTINEYFPSLAPLETQAFFDGEKYQKSSPGIDNERLEEIAKTWFASQEGRKAWLLGYTIGSKRGSHA